MFKRVKQILSRMTNVGPTVSAIPKINQDVAPPEGYPSIRIRRGNPNRLWSTTATSVAVGLVVLYGWYKVYLFRSKRRELDYEQRLLETTIAPFLTAEKDISYTVQLRAFKKSVEKLMKDKPNFDPKQEFYHHKKRFNHPTYSLELSKFLGTGVLEADSIVEKEIKTFKQSQ